jgi:potassium-transporting ATPase potassium-binding subunit
MTANGWFRIGLYFLVILLVTKPIGVFIMRVFNREKTLLDPVLRPIERFVYRLTGVDQNQAMRWTDYTISMLCSAEFR